MSKKSGKRYKAEMHTGKLLGTLYKLKVIDCSHGYMHSNNEYQASVGVKAFINRMYNQWVIPVKT